MPIDRIKYDFNEPQFDALDRTQDRYGRTNYEMDIIAQGLVTGTEKERELAFSQLDPVYFLNEFAWMYNKAASRWESIELWDSQIPVVYEVLDNNKKYIIILKARQLGITTVILLILLYLLLFKHGVRGLCFSKLEDDANELVGDDRLWGMYERLPEHFKALAKLQIREKRVNYLPFRSCHGKDYDSKVFAFTTTRGDSRVGTYVMIDEADLMPDLIELYKSAKPTVDDVPDGKFILLSKSYKKLPNSIFKKMYRSAKSGLNEFHHIFLPWNSHPGRTEEWYEKEKQDTLKNTGSLDALYENYPATDEEALAAMELDKRIPATHLYRCYHERTPITNEAESGIRQIKGINIYHLPEDDERYFIGVDASEGLEGDHRDYSAIYVVDSAGIECANLVGKITADGIAYYAKKLALYYKDARILPENQGIGLATVTWLINNGMRSHMIKGNGRKWGWTPSKTSKIILYENVAEMALNEEMVIYDYACYAELQSIEANTLSAPPGDHDDRADAFAMAQMCRTLGLKKRAVGVRAIDWGGLGTRIKQKTRAGRVFMGEALMDD